MDFLQIITIVLQITHIFTRRSKSKYQDSSSSEDSIENLLYFKDCQTKKESEAPPVSLLKVPPPTPMTPPTPKNECPFPRMCCSMTCGNQCGGQQDSSFISRPADSMHLTGRQGLDSFQPPMKPFDFPQSMFPVQSQIRKRKKTKMPTPGLGGMQSPMYTRRNLGNAKDLIKDMINQDPDIKSILKDLVKVTMRKVSSKYNDNDGLVLTSSTTQPPVEENYDEFMD